MISASLPSPTTFAPIGSAALLELFYNSFVFAAGSVLLALPVAVMFAWLIERTNTPLRTLAYALVIAPVAMPGMLLSMSWVLLLSPNVGIINRTAMLVFGLDSAPFNIYSLGGMIFTEGLRLVPTTFLLLVGAFRAMDPSLEEAALVSGARKVITTLRITLPVMFPAILTAAIYVFMTAIESFEIPGCPWPAQRHLGVQLENLLCDHIDLWRRARITARRARSVQPIS